MGDSRLCEFVEQTVFEFMKIRVFVSTKLPFFDSVNLRNDGSLKIQRVTASQRHRDVDMHIRNNWVNFENPLNIRSQK